MKDWVIADNPVVGSILRKIVSVVVDGGAELHPSLRMMEKNGALWLRSEHSSPMAALEREECSLVRMPPELLVPLDGSSWEYRTDRLVLIQSPEGLTPVQRELLDLHIALYNTAGKLPWFVRNHPAVLLQDNPSVRAAVLRLRPEQEVTWITPADAFIKTRLCRFQRLTENGSGQSANEKVKGRLGLLPIIDLFNNRHDAPRFGFSGCGGVSVRSDSLRTSSECFANYYGVILDVLDLALGSGYLDHTTPYAHSAPVEAQVPGFGTLAVEGVIAKKPAQGLDPPRVQFTAEGLSLSHLTCNTQKPERMHVALALAVQGALRRRASLGKATPEGTPTAGVLAALVMANLALLADVEQAAAPLREQWPSADLLISACRRQAELFAKGMAVQSP